jgi:shikimate kinase
VTDAVVCLVGLRCAGKTVVGECLARHLGVPFADLDRDLAADWALAEGLEEVPEAGEVLARLGEPAFRKLEERILAERVEAGGPLVLATGGGAVESPASRTLLSARTVPVWLRVETAELQRRMRADPSLRPGLLGADPVAEVPALAVRRSPLYESVARHVIDAALETPESLAKRIAAVL